MKMTSIYCMLFQTVTVAYFFTIEINFFNELRIVDLEQRKEAWQCLLERVDMQDERLINKQDVDGTRQ